MKTLSDRKNCVVLDIAFVSDKRQRRKCNKKCQAENGCVNIIRSYYFTAAYISRNHKLSFSFNFKVIFMQFSKKF